MKNKDKFLLVVIIFIAQLAFGQNFANYKPVEQNEAKKLFFNFQSTSFLKNNEYFSSFSNGFTGIGFFLKPAFEYQPSEKTKIRLGYYFLKYFGDEGFQQTIPIFSVQQKLADNLDLVFGDIYGTLNHGLEEPLFCFDNYYQKNTEYGLQFLWKSSKIHSDLWLDWEKFIFPRDTFQEELTVGNVTDFHFDISEKVHLKFPVQWMFKHKGGQINVKTASVVTIFNGLIGTTLKFSLSDKSSFSISQLFLMYNGGNLPEKGDPNWLPFEKGNGFYTKISGRVGLFEMLLGYWKGYRFYAPHGEHLFMSVSNYDSDVAVEGRKLLTSKMAINKTVSESVKLSFHTDVYYDLDLKNIDYSFGLYILVDEGFLILR